MNEPAEPVLASPRPPISPLLGERSGVLLAALVLVALFAAGRAMDWPVAAAWALLGVEHEGLAFLDLAMLTGAADCASRGIDPYTTAACDPINRIYNYPPVMLLLLEHIGLRESHTVPAGLALVVAFFASLVWVMKARTLLGHAIVFFAVMSYPVLWGIERANVDLAIFIACVWVCLLLGSPRAGALRQAAAAGIVLLLFLAKLYPIAATTAFWRDRKTLLAALALSTLALLAYVASDPAMFAAVRKLTPSMTERSYGASVLTGRFYMRTSEGGEYGLVPRPAQLAGYLLSAVALLGAAIVAFGRGRAVTKGFDLRPSVNLQLALAGTAIYCLTYCLGTNFNYRLIFLTMAIPYFVQGWEARGHRSSLWLGLATVALLLAKWQTHYGFDYRSSEILPTAAELLAFALFVTYSIGLLSYAVTLVKRPTAAR